MPKDYKDLDLHLKIKVLNEFIFLEIVGENINKTAKLDIKNEKAHFAVNRYLFDLFSKHEDFDCSFGILTGVRPLKLLSKVFESTPCQQGISYCQGRKEVSSPTHAATCT